MAEGVILALPNEVQVLIWTWLPPQEIFKQTLVCKHWKVISEQPDEYLWRVVHNRCA